MQYLYNKACAFFNANTLAQRPQVISKRVFSLNIDMFHVSIVYERKFIDGDHVNFRCLSCSTIDVVWASYGVEGPRRQIPLAISSNNQNCVTNATGIMQRNCNGKDQCFFLVQTHGKLPSNCGQNTILLVRYTCKTNLPGKFFYLY